MKPGNGEYLIGAQTGAELTIADDEAGVILTLDDRNLDEATQGRFPILNPHFLRVS
jgi:hypothetical protein